MSSYLKFSAYLCECNKQHGLNHIDVALLDLLAIRLMADHIIYVKDMIGQNQIASQATLHKSLINLKKKKLIKFNPDPQDNRCKAILLTNNGSQRIANLNKAIDQFALKR